MSLVPFTLDGREIPADAPRSEGMTDTFAADVVDAAAELRDVTLHCHYDLTGRTITLHAANAPEGEIFFLFGDGTADESEQVTGPEESASVEHTYAADGVYSIGVYTATDRWITEVAVNWPPYQEAP